MEQLEKVIQAWADAERAYVMTVINHRIGSPEECKALRTMEGVRQTALTVLQVNFSVKLRYRNVALSVGERNG